MAASLALALVEIVVVVAMLSSGGRVICASFELFLALNVNLNNGGIAEVAFFLDPMK